MTTTTGMPPRATRTPPTGLLDDEDRRLLAAVRAGRRPEGGFPHAQHVRLARIYLTGAELDQAVPRYCRDLRRFATALGAPDKYHETITRAFLLLVAERIARTGPGETFEAFADRHPDLMAWRPSILERYYHRETLASEFARRHFVLPDAGLAESAAGATEGRRVIY